MLDLRRWKPTEAPVVLTGMTAPETQAVIMTLAVKRHTGNVTMGLVSRRRGDDGAVVYGRADHPTERP